jgi:hypothetical protein
MPYRWQFDTYQYTYPYQYHQYSYYVSDNYGLLPAPWSSTPIPVTSGGIQPSSIMHVLLLHAVLLHATMPHASMLMCCCVLHAALGAAGLPPSVAAVVEAVVSSATGAKRGWEWWLPLF